MAISVTIVDPPPPPSNTGTVAPGNLLARCEVQASDGAATATRVQGRSYMPGQTVPATYADALTKGLQNFTNTPPGSSTWITTNLPNAKVGAGNVVQVWATFASAPGSPTPAQRDFTGT